MSTKPIVEDTVNNEFYKIENLIISEDDIKYDLNVFDKKHLLHRYRNISEYTFSDLLNDEITFTSPDLFNDPYDSSYMFRTPDIKVSATMVYKPNGGKEVEVKGNKGKLMPAGARIVDNSLHKFIKNYVRVACFSEKNTNEVMWSHYASQAKGIILSYSIEQLEKLMKENNIVDHVMTPIFYKNHKLFFNPISKNSDEEKMSFYMNKVMLLKNEDWNYEREWRLIFSSLNEKRFSDVYINLKGIRPKKIFLGEKINPTYSRIIKDIAKDKKIKVFQAYTIQKSNNREIAFHQVECV